MNFNSVSVTVLAYI